MRVLIRAVAYILLLLVLVFGVYFTLQNPVTVPLDLLWVQFAPRPLAWWVLSAFALGGLLGLIVGSLALVRIKNQQLLLKRRLRIVEKELEKTRLVTMKT